MSKYTRDFKGVWIPKEIWLSESLSLMEKVLFVEIHSLDNEKGCWASNRHFSEFFGISDRQIRTYIASLKKKTSSKSQSRIVTNASFAAMESMRGSPTTN